MTIAIVCLALNIYHEARGESIDGQFLVAESTINRSIERNQIICDVVYDEYQYSWTHDNVSDTAYDEESFVIAAAIAAESLAGNHLHSGVTHYHSVSVNPPWAKRLKILGRYGNHIFYVE